MRIVVGTAVDESAERVWNVLTDWERQGEWMPATTVRADGHGLSTRIEAWTGIGRIGFLDTMEITVWDPPRRCDVMHTGRVVRGPASFLVAGGGSGRCRVTWVEDLQLPGGAVGRASAWLVRPLASAALRFALARFRRYVRRSRPDGR